MRCLEDLLGIWAFLSRLPLPATSNRLKAVLLLLCCLLSGLAADTSLPVLGPGAPAKFSLLTDPQKTKNSVTEEDVEESRSKAVEQPGSFWLSGFFFPQGFLTAVLQNYARAKGISVDSLGFLHHVQPVNINVEPILDVKKKHNVTEMAFKSQKLCRTNWLYGEDKEYWTPNGSSSPAEGVLVFGLYLDGARWNPEVGALEDSELRDRFYPLPEIHFVPQQIINETGNIDSNEKNTCYECPLYRTPQRAGILSSTGLSTNFVTSINLPTQIRARHWITRGVALLCQLDD